MNSFLTTIMFAIVVCFLLIQETHESHFRGGSITAKPISFTATQATLEVTITMSWRNSFSAAFACNAATVANGQLTGPSGDFVTCRLIGTQTCSNNLISCDTVCLAFQPLPDDWTYGKKTVTLTLPQARYYEASYESSNWMKLNGGGSEGTWAVRIRMDTNRRSDNGEINTTPISTIPPIVKFRRGVRVTIPIVTADSDVDTVRCRWATSTNNECGGVCQNSPIPARNQFNTAMSQAVPPATLNETSCMLTFDGTLPTAISPGFYAVALQIEDFMNPQDTQPLSSVPLQFLIQLVTISSTCTNAPEFVGDRPSNGCFATRIGVPFRDRMVAQCNCPNATIISIQVLGLSGSSVSPLARIGTNQWALNLTWTPTQKQSGPNIVCGFATDSTFLVAFNCYTIIAGISQPSIVSGTQAPRGVLAPALLNNPLITWSVDLDESIQQGNLGQFISIFNRNGQLYTQIDATSNDVSINNYTLEFTTSNQIPIGDYYITLDYGVARGLLFCGPYSNEQLSPLFWTFTINATATTTTPITTITPTTTTTTFPSTTTVIPSTTTTIVASSTSTVAISSTVPGATGSASLSSLSGATGSASLSSVSGATGSASLSSVSGATGSASLSSVSGASISTITTTNSSVAVGDKKQEDSSNLGAIIGGAVGGIAAVAGVGAGIFLAIRKFKQAKEAVQSLDDMRLVESPTPSSQSDASSTSKITSNFKNSQKTSTGIVNEKMSRTQTPVESVEMPKNKTRKTGFSMNQFIPEAAPKQDIPLRPPPKNKMMGPLVKNKNFNLPLEDGIKAYIESHK